MLPPRLTFRQWAWMQLLSLKAVLKVIALTVPTVLWPGRLGQKLSDERRLRNGLILVLPGIEGESPINHSIAQGLCDAGIADAIEIFDWTRGRIFYFSNLMNLGRNAAQARRLADRIRQYQQEHAGCPVHLVAHSGGAGLAVMALEQLDEDHRIAAAILLAPALSPKYNLVTALRRTDHGIHSLYSPHDNLYLGVGTAVFGTVDRKRTVAAGKVGFQMPEGLLPADADVYRTKLRQVSWRHEMLAEGHFGGHIGWSSRQFVRNWLGRIVLDHRLGTLSDSKGPGGTAQVRGLEQEREQPKGPFEAK